MLEITLRTHRKIKHLEGMGLRKYIKGEETLSVVNKEIPGLHRKVEMASTILKNDRKILQ